jgi:nitroreductase
MIKDLIYRTRSYRKFDQNQNISCKTLENLIDLARHSASAANLQSLKYILSCNAIKNDKIFRRLKWAAYLNDWPGPEEGERPAAYIILLGDTNIYRNFYVDHGIACQNILLGATELGLGGCIIASINRGSLRKDLQIEERFKILLVVALGKPKETVKIEYITAGGDIKYWRDNTSVHHVPKRPLDEIIWKSFN